MSAIEAVLWLIFIYSLVWTGWKVFFWYQGRKLPPFQKIAEMAECCMVRNKYISEKAARTLFASNDMGIDVSRVGSPLMGFTCIRIFFKNKPHKLTIEFQGAAIFNVCCSGTQYVLEKAQSNAAKKKKSRSHVMRLSPNDLAAIDRIFIHIFLDRPSCSRIVAE